MNNKMVSRVFHFLKSETVLSVAGLLAFISAFFVRPSVTYFDYIDYRVLALLFCLMLVVAGFQSIGVFHFLGNRLLTNVKNSRQLILVLTGLCFFSAMLITNDVALITFVPFAIMTLTMSGLEQLMIPVICLQTIAANLGSMLTPIGSPQNLYLYSMFSIPIGSFLTAMLPLTVLSLILIVVAVFFLKKSSIAENDEDSSAKASRPDTKKLIAFSLLFLVCLLSVIRVLPWPVMLAVVLFFVLIIDRKLFREVDYLLLLTFVFFFLFIGNIQRVPLIADFLRSFIAGKEFILSTLFSQCISNVPAAILLSGFTEHYRPLLYGINIGGLGTLIASLASVISFRLYGNSKGASKGAYMKTFTVYNLVFLMILFLCAYLYLQLLPS